METNELSTILLSRESTHHLKISIVAINFPNEVIIEGSKEEILTNEKQESAKKYVVLRDTMKFLCEQPQIAIENNMGIDYY